MKVSELRHQRLADLERGVEVRAVCLVECAREVEEQSSGDVKCTLGGAVGRRTKAYHYQSALHKC